MVLHTHSVYSEDSKEIRCCCNAVHALRAELSLQLHQHGELQRKVVRLETIVSEILEMLETCDDVALQEKNTCSAVVYNEQLTAKHPLRLLRCEVKRLQEKYIL